MISGWVGDRSAGPVCVSLSWIGAMFVDRTVVRGSERFFVDQSAGSWVGARVRGSEWIGAMLSLVRGSFVDRSDVLSGSWIVRGSERCAWVGALWFVDRSGSEHWILGRMSSFWFVDRSAVPGSELTVLGSDWVGALVAWIGASYLLRCVAVRGSTLCCCVCVGFLFRFSLLSVLLCVEM